MRALIPKIPLATVLAILLTAPASGQWAEQTFQLVEGWNSIFLEVSPAPRLADDLFAGQPIETVWARSLNPLPGFGPDCDSRTDPDCIAPHDTMWRVWFPPGEAPSAVKTLRVIEGGFVYAIKATEATELTIVGRPSGLTVPYRPGFNLAGFYVNPAGPPTIENYLAPAGPLNGPTVYTIQPDGTLAAVAISNPVTPGLGYWVSSSENLVYGGPLSIDFATQTGIVFGKRQLTHSIEFINLTPSARDVTATYVSSAVVPNVPDLPTNAGDVPLHRLDYGAGELIENILQWRPLATFTVAVTPNSLQTPPTTLAVGVRRAGLAEAVLDIEFLGSEYQGILQITDDAGFRRLISLTTEALPTAGGAGVGGQGEIMPRPGLYLGFVTVDQVSWVTAGARVWTNDDPTDPEFDDGLLRCFGGGNDGNACFPDRRLCVGTPEIELTSITCEDDGDCPPDGTCAVITDCPDGACNGFCIGGTGPGDPCIGSDNCPGEEGNEGVCSGDLDSSVLRPTPFAFEFPVIIHLSDDDHLNQYTMLIEVSLLKDENDALVLATPDCDPNLCDDLVGALTVNGAPFARRVSTAMFSFANDLEFDQGGDFSTFLAGATTLAADDPLNPFLHTFHPDHDCVDADGNPIPGECFEITRSFVFAFESEPPNGESELDWGDSVIGGIYTEQVSGLHRDPIAAQGRFRLRRVSDLGALNTPIGGGGAQ